MNEIEIIENWVKLGLTEGSKNVRNISLAFETAAVCLGGRSLPAL